ncbi:Coiled-coil-helix-coiled-coil-helix domain-containing protein 2 [Holothuria leucospilota]|uniref:Coiled-coil-helix-coiled-coil-helix domain-containing protein 2 n=1 Tax=Holothuria leucospilota TaxID=206669 RepID=A0A9Q1CE09_HOLLE|nr:Coiled-coil-helix-coiled-coil-helix domain-containing protein 2 [Holothuria leucospilota]
MPRGGRSRGRSMSPVRRSPAPRTTAVAPTPSRAPAPVPQQQVAMGQPRQPGLLGQMAATAGGVAIGSTVGHVVGSAITGGGHSGQPDVTYQEPAPLGGQPHQQQQYQNPCQIQIENFLQCTQTQADISICQGFNDALKECKLAYGLQ